VTPFHLTRLKRLERFLKGFPIPRASYLFVPNYHGLHGAADHPEFIQWCRDKKPWEIGWFLHGCTHLDERAGQTVVSLSIKEKIKRCLLTGSEGEFAALDRQSMLGKIKRGKDIFARCLPDACLEGFVAPAWLYHDGLFPVLREEGLSWTEDHGKIYHLASGKAWAAPVVTWATRSPARKYGSIAYNTLLIRNRRSAPLLRIALHPYDMDHPRTVSHIKNILNQAINDREPAAYPALSESDERIQPKFQ